MKGVHQCLALPSPARARCYLGRLRLCPLAEGSRDAWAQPLAGQQLLPLTGALGSGGGVGPGSPAPYPGTHTLMNSPAHSTRPSQTHTGTEHAPAGPEVHA